MVRQSADTWSSVSMVIAETVIVSHVLTQLLTLSYSLHIVEDRVHSLDESSNHWLELTDSLLMLVTCVFKIIHVC